MPSPLAHIRYAQVLLHGRPDLELPAFYRGTIFPDSRYIAGVDRSSTHDETVFIGQVWTESDSWRAGWLLHNWLDVEWTRHIARYEFPPGATEAHWFALKLLEEELLYPCISDKDQIADMLPVVDQAAVDYGAGPADIQRWGCLIAAQLHEPDASRRFLDLVRQLRFDPPLVRSIQQAVKVLKNDDSWIQRLETVRKQLTQSVEDYHA